MKEKFRFKNSTNFSQDISNAHCGQHDRRRVQRFDYDNVDIRHAKIGRDRIRGIGLVGSLVFNVRVRVDSQRYPFWYVGHAGLRASVPLRTPQFGEYWKFDFIHFVHASF